ncbi:M48 family metallopeptidase [Pontibacter cellulosilyticus]|uniref:M48 family metallopeptidase n=1 Tax=Pontibacter cellulosilyticus TaxID=1720253 RepID=A0A923SI88_9BACT|nr:M48 family metallopeptidase [Pontibacter cellulosilyticus]MBC5992544.1 M48 family metallopeptidase [Pontibacter cellulosilyticus]
MYKKLIAFSMAVAMFVGCTTVPITGRRQLSLVSESEMQAMSYEAYDQFLKENKLSNNAQATAMVKRVGNRIKNAVEQYMAANNLSSELQGYKWEYNLIEDDQVNAFAMAGGKTVVYEGILPVAQNETGLAVVMGHEIAHAIAKHGSERMSQALAQQFGGQTLSALAGAQPGTASNLVMAVYGVGSQLGLLKYGRTQESEADRLGLIFMAMAGYDPQQAIPFWQRMEAKGGQAPPEFLSTHPSAGTRQADLKKHMPEALQYYKAR